MLNLGHIVEIPLTAQKIINQEVSLGEIDQEKQNGQFASRGISFNALQRYFKLINESDVLFVINKDKNGIKNYIGGATFLEMGYAHALNKRIYCLNDLPIVSYREEIDMMKPVIINGDLSKII